MKEEKLLDQKKKTKTKNIKSMKKTRKMEEEKLLDKVRKTLSKGNFLSCLKFDAEVN